MHGHMNVKKNNDNVYCNKKYLELKIEILLFFSIEM